MKNSYYFILSPTRTPLFINYNPPSNIIAHLSKYLFLLNALTFSFSLFFPFHSSLIMYSSNPSAPPKYSDAPQPFGQAPATGFPVNSTNQYQERPQTAPFQVQSTAPGLWSTGLCDCCDDVPNCKNLTFSCGHNIVFISRSFHLVLI